jgi:hypothetical protein
VCVLAYLINGAEVALTELVVVREIFVLFNCDLVKITENLFFQRLSYLNPGAIIAL